MSVKGMQWARRLVFAAALATAAILLLLWVPASAAGSGSQGLATAEAVQAARVHSYGVVVDGGSTGTRVHIFGFDEAGDALWEDFTAHDRALGRDDTAACLDPLIGHVLGVLPRAAAGGTPVFVGATAGLRKLGEARAATVLREASAVVAAAGLRPAAASRILTGESEGAFAWVTVNYLLGHLRGGVRRTAGVLDCGGGSFQVVTTDTRVGDDSGERVSVYGREHRLHVFSGLGYGMNEGVRRMGPCKGFAACTREAEAVLAAVGGSEAAAAAAAASSAGGRSSPALPDPVAVATTPFYAFSYYFKVFGARTETGATAQGLWGAAKRVCDGSGGGGGEAAACANAAYLAALTRRVGLGDTSRLNVAKKLEHRGGMMETAWPLGACLTMKFG